MVLWFTSNKIVQLVYLIVEESKEEIREIIRNTLKLILSLDVNTNLINFIGNGMVGSGEVRSGVLTEMRIETLNTPKTRSTSSVSVLSPPHVDIEGMRTQDSGLRTQDSRTA